MADRYWVGGTGTWSSTNTLNWSSTLPLSFTASRAGNTLTTVGSPAIVVPMELFDETGASKGVIVSGSADTWTTSSSGTITSQTCVASSPPASVPTAADNVFFNATSNGGVTAFTVTMANSPRVCNDLTIFGLDGTMTLAGTSIGLTVSGSLTFQATNFTRTYTGVTTFNATTTGKTVTINGVSLGTVTFNGVGGAWTLGSFLGCGSNVLTITNGTFDTSASNYGVSCGSLVSSTGTRTINFRDSTITPAGLGQNTTLGISGLTFIAGNSTISFGSNHDLLAGGLTFYNVRFLTTFTEFTIGGANTFNNLTITRSGSGGSTPVLFTGNQTINGIFQVNTVSPISRITIASGVGNEVYARGTTRTLTCASITAMSDVDFGDITIAGAHGTLSGTRLGDCGGNSNITFNAGKTVYWNLAAGGSWQSTAWALSAGGAVSVNNFPLAQDTAIILNTGLSTGETLFLGDVYNIGTVDFSARTNSLICQFVNVGSNFFGDFIYGSGVTTSGASNTVFTFVNRSIKTINSAGKTFPQSITVDSPSGGIQLVANNLTIASTLTTKLTKGTLDLQSYTLSTGLFSSNNSNVRTLAFGTGKIDLTGTGTAWDALTATNFSTSGSKTVNFTSVGSTTITCNSGLSEADAVDFNVIGGTYQFRFGYTSGTSSVRNLNFTGFSGSWDGLLGTAIIYGNLTMSATMTTGSSGTKKFSATSGTKTITSNGASLNIVEFDGVSGTWQLQDNMNLTQPTGIDFKNGTVDLNGQTLTTLRGKTSAGTKNITFNGGTLAITDTSIIAWYNINPTGFTTTAGTGTGTISMTAATAKSFQGGGSTFNCTLNQGGAGDLTVTGSNTFLDITNTVQPASVLFTSGATNTFLSGFSLSGTAGNLITIGSTSSSSHTLSKASGTVSVSFCSISRSSATGGATWEALTTNGNVDGGNNTGWIFVLGSTATGSFLMFF